MAIYYVKLHFSVWSLHFWNPFLCSHFTLREKRLLNLIWRQLLVCMTVELSRFCCRPWILATWPTRFQRSGVVNIWILLFKFNLKVNFSYVFFCQECQSHWVQQFTALFFGGWMDGCKKLGQKCSSILLKISQDARFGLKFSFLKSISVQLF